METKPMEREMMMKKKLQRPSWNYRPPGPVLLPIYLPRCFREVKTIAVKKLRLELPPQPPEVPPIGTTAKIAPKFRKRVKRPLEITASKAVISGSRPVVGRYYHPDRYYRPFWPVLPPRPELPPSRTGTSADTRFIQNFQHVTYPFDPPTINSLLGSDLGLELN
jgi:hypothetical protein